MDNNELNTNEQVNQPVEPSVQEQPVEQVAPAAPEVQVTQIPAEAPTKKGGNNALLIVLLLIILLAGAGCAYYFLIVKQQANTPVGGTTTTTTTTTVSSVNYTEPTTLDEYLKNVNVNKDKSSLKIINGSYKNIDTEFISRCKNDGDTVSFENNEVKYDYTCQVKSDEKFDNGLAIYIKGKINGTYNFSQWNYPSNENVKVEDSRFIMNDYYTEYYSVGKDPLSYIRFINKDNEKIELSLLNKNSDGYINPYIIDGFIFMIVVDEDNSDLINGEYKCNIMKYDLKDISKGGIILGSFDYHD